MEQRCSRTGRRRSAMMVVVAARCCCDSFGRWCGCRPLLRKAGPFYRWSSVCMAAVSHYAYCVFPHLLLGVRYPSFHEYSYLLPMGLDSLSFFRKASFSCWPYVKFYVFSRSRKYAEGLWRISRSTRAEGKFIFLCCWPPTLLLLEESSRTLVLGSNVVSWNCKVPKLVVHFAIGVRQGEIHISLL